nr:MAG TPA: hypothetical protein [Caudoviricetes sp.]
MAIEKFIKLIYVVLLCFMLSVGAVSALFGYYIYKSYESSDVSIKATQDGSQNRQEVINEE